MKKILAVLLCIALLLTAGCAVKPKNNKKNLILASFYPVYIFTLNLTDGIDALSVECMAEQNTGCLHDYTVSSKDARLLNDCDLFIINGAGMEGFVEDLYLTVENLKIVDSSQGAKVVCSENHHHHHAENDVEMTVLSHVSFNSHIWLSVNNAKIQVRNIADGIKEAFPKYAGEIDANCEKYISQLNELEKSIFEASKSVKGKCFVTFHNAYAYLAEDMGFSIAHTIESDENGEPSAKKLAELTDEIKKSNISALFVEATYTGSAANILSSETGVPVYKLNPVLNGEKAKTAYIDIMKENIEIILKAVK